MNNFIKNIDLTGLENSILRLAVDDYVIKKLNAKANAKAKAKGQPKYPYVDNVGNEIVELNANSTHYIITKNKAKPPPQLSNDDIFNACKDDIKDIFSSFMNYMENIVMFHNYIYTHPNTFFDNAIDNGNQSVFILDNQYSISHGAEGNHVNLDSNNLRNFRNQPTNISLTNNTITPTTTAPAANQEPSKNNNSLYGKTNIILQMIGPMINIPQLLDNFTQNSCTLFKKHLMDNPNHLDTLWGSLINYDFIKTRITNNKTRIKILHQLLKNLLFVDAYTNPSVSDSARIQNKYVKYKLKYMSIK